jgi:RNA polymerase sigma-70 factor (ECF subfamily)
MDDRQARGSSPLDAPDALIGRARAGDEAAFARIVRLHRASMVRVALVVTGDVDRAADAVAGAWPSAWGGLRRLADPSRLGPWLAAVAAAEAARRTERLAERLGGTTPEEGHRAGTDAVLARALATLTVSDRALLALRHVAGLTPPELARATRSSSAVAAERCRLAEAGLVDALAEAGCHEVPVGAALESAPGGMGLAERIRSHVDVPIAHVDIDAVARRARDARRDHRSRMISLIVAFVAAAIVVAVPYIATVGQAASNDPGWAVPTPALTAPAIPAPAVATPVPVDPGEEP